MKPPKTVNARLRGWQRITPNSNPTTETTAAQWDWKRHALTVPLEAFVKSILMATFYLIVQQAASA
ncbi:hypothetical protein FUB07_18020 [Vibrio cholerae]|nr:hypothetical protein [Vibrio cholerae]